MSAMRYKFLPKKDFSGEMKTGKARARKIRTDLKRGLGNGKHHAPNKESKALIAPEYQSRVW